MAEGLKSQEDECDQEKRKEILAVADDGERENDNEEEGDVDKNIEEDIVDDVNGQERNMPEMSKEWGGDKKDVIGEEVKVMNMLREWCFLLFLKISGCMIFSSSLGFF